MPLYQFRSEDGEVLSITMDTKQPLEAYHFQKVDGKVYKRVYTVPNMSVDSRPGLSESEFRRATSSKNMKVGEMQALSREMHEKRTEKEGRDEVKEKWYDQYEKNIGKKHDNVVRRETQAQRRKKASKAKEKLKKYGVEVSF